jgi:cytochrome c oxidase subunit 3
MNLNLPGVPMQTEGELLNFPFEEAGHQRESALFGMWLFLATEVLFFGGLFAAYTVYRYGHSQAFMEAGRHQEWYLGCLNTILLLTSGFSMALAVQFARLRLRGGLLGSLAATWVLGAAFLAVEGYEYYDKFRQHLFPGPAFRFTGSDPAASQLFFVLYFTMTGLHMLHMLIGLVFIAGLGFFTARTIRALHRPNLFEVLGLYWAFVDIVWLFLYPLFYLVSPK